MVLDHPGNPAWKSEWIHVLTHNKEQGLNPPYQSPNAVLTPLPTLGRSGERRERERGRATEREGKGEQRQEGRRNQGQ